VPYEEEFPEDASTMAPGRSLCPFGAPLVFIFKKIKKEETTMATKKSTWVVIGFFIIGVDLQQRVDKLR